ncbi:MAG: PIN domain-containing protein, partial [Actinomycetota bacterium]
MTASSRGLLDTSVLIATETGRPVDSSVLPDEVFISVVTIAELQAGVLAATDTATRARRLATLDSVAGLEALPIDVAAA